MCVAMEVGKKTVQSETMGGWFCYWIWGAEVEEVKVRKKSQR